MKHHQVDCGFVRLTDSAVLVAALEMGFAAEEGVDLVLHRETNWSSIRDKIGLGIYPAAHMLAPLALAMSMGVGPLSQAIIAPFVLSQNGTTLTATPETADALRDVGSRSGDVRSVGQAIARLAARHPLRIGVPFPQSMHLLLSRFFVEASGGDLSQISYTIAPPPVLPEVIAAREVDLVMVGEPWGSVAVERGDTEILIPGAAIWGAAPEKVLAVREDWAENNPETLRRMIRALSRAADWCARPDTRASLAEFLAMPRYLDAPSHIVERALTGQLVLNAQGSVATDPLTLRLGGGDVNYPWQSAGTWIAKQAAAQWGVAQGKAAEAAKKCFRTDIYRQAMAPLGGALPEAPTRTEGLEPDGRGFFDGRVFDESAQ